MFSRRLKWVLRSAQAPSSPTALDPRLLRSILTSCAGSSPPAQDPHLLRASLAHCAPTFSCSLRSFCASYKTLDLMLPSRPGRKKRPFEQVSTDQPTPRPPDLNVVAELAAQVQGTEMVVFFTTAACPSYYALNIESKGAGGKPHSVRW